jgi:ubiquinone/menaquinone biosynthesis C-methylase UbiE|tara:strand:- start:230 stop:925 length:696 start_codon:yes stop_codon:yes gene_type:complete
MSREKEIYRQHADRYDLLVSREDCRSNIRHTLDGIVHLDSKDIVDLGAGTGRLTLMLVPVARSMHALDLSQHMLTVAAEKLKKTGLQHWATTVGDTRGLPLHDRSADVAVAGWSMCYLVTWNEHDWHVELSRGMAEMRRVLRPGGTAIILETLGTGHASPHPPEHLIKYYRFLRQSGFSSTWIRSDYRFQSLAEAVELSSFFFGDELGKKVSRAGTVTVPECTGVWWLKMK